MVTDKIIKEPIHIRQKKTGGLEYLDINHQAVELMGDEGKPESHIFADLLTTSATNRVIQEWYRVLAFIKRSPFIAPVIHLPR